MLLLSIGLHLATHEEVQPNTSSVGPDWGFTFKFYDMVWNFVKHWVDLGKLTLHHYYQSTWWYGAAQELLGIGVDWITQWIGQNIYRNPFSHFSFPSVNFEAKGISINIVLNPNPYISMDIGLHKQY